MQVTVDVRTATQETKEQLLKELISRLPFDINWDSVLINIYTKDAGWWYFTPQRESVLVGWNFPSHPQDSDDINIITIGG